MLDNVHFEYIYIPESSQDRLFIVSFQNKTKTILNINGQLYHLNSLVRYKIPVLLSSALKITSTLDLPIFDVYEYGESKICNEYHYNIFYSFDREYFIGFFASCLSLLTNIKDKNRIQILLISICIPFDDLVYFEEQYVIFLSRIKVDFNLSINLVVDEMIDQVFTETKVFRGGNHLLNVGNFSRLLIGTLFKTDKILYLDSDSIVQTDLLQILDRIDIGESVLIGKKSELTLKNLLNSNYYRDVTNLLGRELNLDSTIIYTGTLIFNSIKFNESYNDILKLVKVHNELPNGLYKLFTMSILNISFNNKISFFDDYLINIVDLGINTIKFNESVLQNADVLDWSGMYKPWFTNGLHKMFWERYNVMDFTPKEMVIVNKRTIEVGLSIYKS